MDKSSAYEKFTGYVDQLRNTECSQKQKIACFQHIAECIMSPALAAHINYAAHCGTATNVLLLFCEDLDSVVRMSAEENLNRIFRALEKTRISRILMDLYGEIKRNGNQRSLRICLNLFAYYAPQIKEKHIEFYAIRLLQCMSTISQRKETLLQETLCEFVKHFARHVQQALNDSDTCKLLEIFLANLSVDCAVKRRCSAQNCISLIEHARNKGLMATHALNKVIELLLSDQETSAVLGALGLLRLLLPLLIRGYNADYHDDGDSLAKTAAATTASTSSECRQIIEIYDYCLHLLSTQHTANHGIINAALEVINAILQSLDAGVQLGESLSSSLRELLCNQQLQHNEYLRRRKSLKNQIFQLKNYEVATSQQWKQWEQQQQHHSELKAEKQQQEESGVMVTASQMQIQKNSNAKMQQQKCQQRQQQKQQPSGSISVQALGINAVADGAENAAADSSSSAADEAKKTTRKHIRNVARSISECVANESDVDDDDDDEDDVELLGEDEYDDFTTLSQLNEPQQTPSTAVTLLTTKVLAAAIDDKLIDAETAAGEARAQVAGTLEQEQSMSASCLPKPQAVQHQSSLQNLLASDDKSQHLSDIDNESFNSIDFDAEITIAGGTNPEVAAGDEPHGASTTTTTGDKASNGADATTIGTFFNNLLSHSNAASESVSKLFRQSSGTKSTPSKSVTGTSTCPATAADKSDAVSAASLTLSLSSLASSSMGTQERQPSIAETPTPVDDSYSATASYTASTAVLMDVEQRGAEQQVVQMRRTPNANPFLVENSPLKQTIVGHVLINVKIGGIHEQPLISYTTRMLAARFLLTGQACGLQPDSVTRVSIKSLSLSVLAQCVRLAPRVLQLRLEISEAELKLLEQTIASPSSTQPSPSANDSPPSSNNSQLGADYEQIGNTSSALLLPTNEDNELLLLDIKDDHFGASTCSYLQQPTLSRSVDAAVLQQQLEVAPKKANKEAQHSLSKSEIIGASYRATVTAEDMPPLSLPPRPPKRTKSMRKSSTAAEPLPPAGNPVQALSDVLLFHAHTDPILRGGVQLIVGNFVQSSGAGLSLPLQRSLCLEHLLAILLKGFEDDIHTVVIQALNAFDKIFPHVVSKYLTAPPCHYHAHQLHQQQKLQKEQQQLLKQQPSVQQKRAAAALPQTFGKQTFAKSPDNALSSQPEQQEQLTDRRPMQQRNSNDGRYVDNLRPVGQAAALATSTCAGVGSGQATDMGEGNNNGHVYNTDNDELVAALLNDFQLQSNCLSHNKNGNNGQDQKLSNEPWMSTTTTTTSQSASTMQSQSTPGPCCVFAISPKLLLNKLRLCHHNKYWLVQNKYAEVISNLNYVLLRNYYGNAGCDFDNNNDNDNSQKKQDTEQPYTQMRRPCNLSAVAYDEDIVCTYEAEFLSELLDLLGDDDARVREHTAACLCRFIMQTARQEQQQPQQQHEVTGNASFDGGNNNNNSSNINGCVNAETQQTNFNLLWDFFDYRIFGSMSVALRNLFRASSTIPPPLAELDAAGLASSSSAASTSGATAAAGGTAGGITSTGDAAMMMMMLMGGGSLGAAMAASAAAAYLDGSYYGVGIGSSIAGIGGIGGIVDGHVFAFQRQIVQEEKVLAKVLYRLTNKLMTLNDKNLQFGIIYTLRLLLKHFNFVDYQQAWREFNFIEICMSYAYFNNSTALDLNCQNDLIDVLSKLVAGYTLSDKTTPQYLDFLLGHSVKLLNIYYHLVNNMRPPQPGSSSRAHKSERFTLHGSSSSSSSSKETAAALQALGYFANDYVYMKLYNILRGANDSYKITINQEAGSLLICLLKSSLNTLNLCLELQSPAVLPPEAKTAAVPALKLIEEILHYLTKLINYAPSECVACLRQLLKYLFGQNYGSRLQPEHNESFIRPYFAAKCGSNGTTINSKAPSASGSATAMDPVNSAMTTSSTSMQNLIEAPALQLGPLFGQGLHMQAPSEGDCVRLIKLFEPLVIYCLTLFMKSNARIQAPILELLSQLLELNVTYSILDSKNVIFEQVLKNLDLIESGIDRNAFIIVPPMLKFLMQLTHKSDRQLITIPKIISITNNLLANGCIRDVALLALKTLSYELFFMHSQVEVAMKDATQRASCQSPLTSAPTEATTEALLAQHRELGTQKEVVLGMLEKFIETRSCQQVLALLLLYERSVQELRAAEGGSRIFPTAQDADAIYGVLCRTLCAGQLRVHTAGDVRLLETCFRNNGNYVLADSKEFLQLLQLFIEQDVGNFGDLAQATIILANVILKTEEIYLVNHIKLYLKNNPTAERQLRSTAAATAATNTLSLQDETPSTSSAAAAARAGSSVGCAAPSSISEINYFAKVLCEKLLACCDAVLRLGSASSSSYCALAARFVNALLNVCCRSRHKDALQSVFRLVLAESEFLCKYYNLLLMSTDAGGGVAGVGVAMAVSRSEALDRLLLACLQLLLAVRLLEPLALLEQAGQLRLKWNMQRAMLHEVCQSCATRDWTPQQVRRLCAGKYLNFLIADHFEFLCELCQVRPEHGSLLLAALQQNAQRLNQYSICTVLRLLWRLCQLQNGDAGCILKSLQLIGHLHQIHPDQRHLQLPMERLAKLLCSHSNALTQREIYENLLRGDLLGCEEQDSLRALLLKELECFEQHNDDASSQQPRIIDESWLFAQLIKFATQHGAVAEQQQQQLMRMLLDIQSEPKLQRLFRSIGSAQEARLLPHALHGALTAMLAAFRQHCIQYTPHINYMQPPPLARVACALLMERVAATAAAGVAQAWPTDEQLHEARALCTLLACMKRIEATALIYIDAKFMDKFVGEHLLRPEQLPLLLAYMHWLCSSATKLLHLSLSCTDFANGEYALGVLLGCIDAMLQQRHIWQQLNQCEGQLRSELLQLLALAARRCLQHTIFYQRHRLAGKADVAGQDDKDCAPQAILLAKLIETQIDIEALRRGEVLATGANDGTLMPFAGHELADVQVPLSLIASIGISLLRTHEFYAYAVTPHELILQQQREQQAQSGTDTAKKLTASSKGKLPTIPVDSLSDVDILRQFVKRLSIFGFTTRQQFEEYFMTFLLLINKIYDEHMVDQQEQFQIKQTCLQAIMELLMTYKTFPIVGCGGVVPAIAPYFHHTTRWARINCDSISLKKLHKAQLLIGPANVFYQPNLERQLSQDNVIGTCNFASNQFDLNFSWAQMESYALLAAAAAEGHNNEEQDNEASRNAQDTAMRNYRHFTQQSEIDFRSSTQLVFDVLQQMIEQNHILVLPNLVKFCEICESRDQIKWIKERALKLQEQIPMDDTISHQHLIYLLCRTQALLIPSHGELQHLCALIGNFYLKSSHCFIRNATLSGLLCLLECCSKTNTTIGKLSEELSLLRDLIVGYINRHGIIDESPLQFSDTHTKLVWTLNYSLIEWTSKFVPQCHLLSNTIIAASNFLKTTNNEELYLCVLHGLERIVVNSGNVTATPTATEQSGSGAGRGDSIGIGGGSIVTPQLRHKIEKLALELLKMENEKFSIPALKLLLSCMYVGSAKQLENTELSNGIVQDDPEIIAQQHDKVDILLHCIKSSTRDAAWIYGQVLCQIIRDLVPPNEILTKVIKEFLAINQPHGDVIAMIVYQVFRSAIDSSFLQMLQDWLICTLPTFLAQPEQQGVWGLCVIFLSASINLHLIKLFPVVLGIGAAALTNSSRSISPTRRMNAAATSNSSALGDWAAVPRKLGQHEIALFVTAAQDFHAKLSAEQRQRFREAFKNYEQSQVYAKMLQRL